MIVKLFKMAAVESAEAPSRPVYKPDEVLQALEALAEPSFTAERLRDSHKIQRALVVLLKKGVPDVDAADRCDGFRALRTEVEASVRVAYRVCAPGPRTGGLHADTRCIPLCCI